MAARKSEKRPVDEDLTDLNARAAAEARAACLPDAVNPPGTASGVKPVTTDDVA